MIVFCINPFPNDNILDWSKLKKFADDNFKFDENGWKFFNPLPHNNTFWRLWETSLLKTLWEKEKLLVTSNFSFSQVFSTHLDNFLLFSSNLKLLSANSFSLEESKICRLVMG